MSDPSEQSCIGYDKIINFIKEQLTKCVKNNIDKINSSHIIKVLCPLQSNDFYRQHIKYNNNQKQYDMFNNMKYSAIQQFANDNMIETNLLCNIHIYNSTFDILADNVSLTIKNIKYIERSYRTTSSYSSSSSSKSRYDLDCCGSYSSCDPLD